MKTTRHAADDTTAPRAPVPCDRRAPRCTARARVRDRVVIDLAA
jgi:hypothetical protein